MANGFFSEDKVSEIRERSNILEVVSDYVTLKKAGKNHRGLCPFHSEKTPSFMVNEEKQIFHCFGCGAGGNVFTFLMKAGNLTFPQAVEELAKRYGIRLPSREPSPAQKREVEKKEVLFQINRIACDYFHDLLTRRREGEIGRRYLSQRGAKDEMIEEHRLGYAPDAWNGLVGHLQEKKVRLEFASELGLIFPKKKGGWYDAFRGRILFPIFDVHGRIVGFGGRLIGQGEPKYLNSPESTIYHKGEILYGLQAAKSSIQEKDSVMIAEGYFDLLALHQNGFKQSVATLGTALTPHHIRTLKRYTKNLVTLFDSDEAGAKANLRSLPLFLEEEVAAKAIFLPKGQDPDEFLRKGNSKEFERRAAGAVPLIDFFFEWLLKNHDMKSIEGKVKVAQEGLGMIGRIPNPIRRNFYKKALAERLNVPQSFLDEAPSSRKTGSFEEGKASKTEVLERLPRSEEMVVGLMLHHPEWIPTISETGILQEFENPALKRMADVLKDLFEKKGKLDISEAMGSVDDPVRDGLSRLLFQQSDPAAAGSPERILKDCIQSIRKKKLRRDEGELLKKIREAEGGQGGNGLDALLMKRQELARKTKGF
ncbi:MAG: DNA primase [Deltaproteobacteria bacterium RBG_13_52_11b]|nr:MAG: DNA primase [Deltaproteobacteria bacterium RBG_13_52_11b]